MKTGSNRSLATMAPWLLAACALVLFTWNIARFFPNHLGRMGYDYGLFLPWLVAGHFWQSVNGVFSPAEFIPSFCGGVPFLFNPQSVFWSLPQMLMTVLPPMASLMLSWTAFGLLGALGMHGLLRRVFLTSSPAALVGAVLFLLNGFYTTRMIIGHVTFHGVMLLPLIAWLVFVRPVVSPSPLRRRAGTVTRALGAGLLLAYLFYSGGTNTILPMMLALLVMALLVAHRGLWHRGILPVATVAVLMCGAMCAYKLLPALAYAGNVVRPISLRMTGNLVTLVGAMGISLFAPQALAWLPADKLVLDRVEFEYGVGLVPLIALGAALWTGWRRGDLGALIANRRWVLGAAMALLLLIPVLVNWDALGLRWLVLHLPIVKMMSVMLRFWFVYVPLLCVLTALLLDYLVENPARRCWWGSAALLLTIGQSTSTDMTYYADQAYDPAPMLTAHAEIASGRPVPPVVRIADPWMKDGKVRSDDAGRNAAFAAGTSDYPCYEPMFGYRLEVFRKSRLSDGPVLEADRGLLNLKNPSCYVFPRENGCRPGDEFTVAQRDEAEAFSHYRAFAYRWPASEYFAAALSALALLLSLVGLAASGVVILIARCSSSQGGKPA